MQFTDDELKVHLRREFQEAWDQGFVNANAEHEERHGQTKLLWSNLLGLALVEEDMQARDDRREIELVVAGASPGTHMPLLLKHVTAWRQTRGVRIHLYDPQPLDARFKKIVDADESMSFERKPFTDDHAKRWASRKHCVVFFSDIRSAIHGKKDHTHKDEVMIEHDMHAQKRWVQIMQPDYCMLKFHAPHATRDKSRVRESLPYLHGTLYEQAYVGLFSAEYRLFCTKADISQEHDYSTAAIEGHAFYHTKNTRPSTFSVNGKAMPYDEAFAAHVAHTAARLLRFDTKELLRDACHMLRVAHMHFAWTRLRSMRTRITEI